MGNARLLTLSLSLAAAVACAGYAIPDPVDGDAGSSPPPDDPVAARPLAAEVGAGGASAQETQEDRGLAPVPSRSQLNLPVRGSGPMIECSGADCPEEGACGSAFIDLDCDGAWKECADGTHRDYRPGDSCSSCVADSAAPRNCEWARGRYLDFLSDLTLSSCADFCNSAADCSAFQIDNACMSDLVLPLYGMIDEEIIQAAESFSNENCAALCGSEPAPGAEQPSGSIACINHRCTIAD